MKKRTFQRLVAPLLVYFVLVSLCGLLWSRPWLLFLLLLALGGVSMLLCSMRAAALAFLVGAFFGPLGESVSIHHGAWSYAGTDGLFPTWLPLAWGVASVCLLSFVSEILRRTSSLDGASARI